MDCTSIWFSSSLGSRGSTRCGYTSEDRGIDVKFSFVNRSLEGSRRCKIRSASFLRLNTSIGDDSTTAEPDNHEKLLLGLDEDCILLTSMTSIKSEAKDDPGVPEPSVDVGNFEEPDANLRCESPKRGTTLSTSTSSFEALDPHDPNLSRLANTMFQKTGEYLQEELTSTHADYRLLERLNKEAIGKYAELKTISSNVSHSLDALNSKYKKLQPVLNNINEIDDSVTKLEQAAYKLAAYSKRLEIKFKELEKESKSK